MNINIGTKKVKTIGNTKLVPPLDNSTLCFISSLSPSTELNCFCTCFRYKLFPYNPHTIYVPIFKIQPKNG